ncbi:MAG: PIG-L family deacetylase [Candidatus Wildermuthbacteria bacterium]|nr:PIG-L family deacetylase [Candidatus Wildermuthbacteria bacterium]
MTIAQAGIKPRILVIAAHPDDEILGCGATLARYIRRGIEAHGFILGKGKSSRFANPGNSAETIQKEQDILLEEAHKAASIIGISRLSFADFPDQRYDSVPFLEIVQRIEDMVEQVKPSIVFTHYRRDLNLDHRITLKAVLTAVRPLPEQSVRHIYSFEVPSSTEWNVPLSFSPNVFIDVKETFDQKLAALQAYESEMREYPHPRSMRAIEIIARRWGTIVGKELVEAFELVREIK